MMADRGGSESRASVDGIEAQVALGGPARSGGGEPDGLRFDFNSILSIADSLPVMVAFCDPQQRYLFLNRAMADWFEKPRAEILGRSMSEILGPAYAVRAPLIAAALGGERQWFASEYDHPTRGPLAVQTEYIPQIDADGTVRGLIMLVEDITEQRLAGRALRESEERFRRIADSAPARVSAIIRATSSG